MLTPRIIGLSLKHSSCDCEGYRRPGKGMSFYLLHFVLSFFFFLMSECDDVQCWSQHASQGANIGVRMSLVFALCYWIPQGTVEQWYWIIQKIIHGASGLHYRLKWKKWNIWGAAAHYWEPREKWSPIRSDLSRADNENANVCMYRYYPEQ